MHQDYDLGLARGHSELTLDVAPVFFDFGSFELRADAVQVLEQIVAILKYYSDTEIEFGSHTDCRGAASYNRWLSQQRAEACANYIRTRVPNPERIYAKGYGEAQPKASCNCQDRNGCSDSQHQMNRRTEVTVLGQ